MYQCQVYSLMLSKISSTPISIAKKQIWHAMVTFLFSILTLLAITDYTAVFLGIFLTFGLLSCLILFLVTLGLTVFCYRRRNRATSYARMKDSSLKEVLLTDTNIVQDRTNLGTDEIILDEQIGSGSFSEVYKGKWLGTTVAIKRFLLNQTASSVEHEEILNDFMKETSLMAGLRQYVFYL